ncbi:MAG: hypothetical protein IIU29_05755, partial [Erysipelotrichaceae bacterium]|nr:hypothetical protein [Erysipelotrichaceae bacterium]
MKKLQPWHNRFYSQILERGRNYYQQGFVKNLQESGGVVSARVGNGYFYNVRVDIDEDGYVKRMRCECP